MQEITTKSEKQAFQNVMSIAEAHVWYHITNPALEIGEQNCKFCKKYGITPAYLLKFAKQQKEKTIANGF
jgi:hypothetical protein